MLKIPVNGMVTSHFGFPASFTGYHHWSYDEECLVSPARPPRFWGLQFAFLSRETFDQKVNDQWVLKRLFRSVCVEGGRGKGITLSFLLFLTCNGFFSSMRKGSQMDQCKTAKEPYFTKYWWGCSGLQTEQKSQSGSRAQGNFSRDQAEHCFQNLGNKVVPCCAALARPNSVYSVPFWAPATFQKAVGSREAMNNCNLVMLVLILHIRCCSLQLNVLSMWKIWEYDQHCLLAGRFDN